MSLELPPFTIEADKTLLVINQTLATEVRCENPNVRRRVQRIIADYPFMGTAISAVRLIHPTINIPVCPIINVAEMLPLLSNSLKGRDASRIGTLEPIDMPTLINLLSQVTTDQVAPILEHEFGILTGLLPDISGTRRYKFRAANGKASLICSHSFKKSGGFYTVTFTGTGAISTFPFTIHVVSYSDMDELDNHGDECPLREAHAIELELAQKGKSTCIYVENLRKRLAELPNDCNCEAAVENDATITIREHEWNEGKGANHVADWIHQAIFCKESLLRFNV